MMATDRRASRAALDATVRTSASAWLVLAFFIGVCTSCLPLASPARGPAADELRRARALDQQGVSAFEAGRYHDALLYFQAAFAHGGPPTERWNQARCYLRLDEPDQAESALLAYVAAPGLPAEDRRDADATLEAIRHRTSMLTVMSAPLGLPVSVDGRRLGITPLSVPVPAGDHVVLVQRAPDGRDERSVTARLGRAILVEARP
jgi:hypothetical protein